MRDLLDAFGADGRDIPCIYSFCDVLCETEEERIRHMMDRHGHSWETAHKSVQDWKEA